MKITNRLILLLLLSLQTIQLFAQKVTADSMVYVERIEYLKNSVLNGDKFSDSADSFINDGLELAKAASDTAALVDFYTLKGDYEKEQNRYDESLAAYEQVVDFISPFTQKELFARTRKKMGNLFWRFNKHNLALQSFLESLRFYQQLGNALEVGKTYNNLGTISRGGSVYDSALYYYNKALTIFTEIDDQYWISSTQNLIGNTYLQMGKPNAALKYYQQSLAIRRTLGDSLAVSGSLTNIAKAHLKQRNDEQALKAANEALEIRRGHNDLDLVASSLVDLGGIYKETGNYAKSIEFFQQALIIRRQLGDELQIAASLLNVGSIYRQLNLVETALEYYTDALELYQKIGDEARVSTVLNYIGGVYYKQGAYDNALDYFLSALGYREVSGDQRQVARISNNVAMIYKNIGNYPKALDYYNEALSYYKKQGNRKQYAATLNHIGNLHVVWGNDSEALNFLKKAYFERREIGDNYGFAHSALDIGEIYLTQEKLTAANAYFSKALEMAKSLHNFELNRDVHFAVYRLETARRKYRAALRHHEKYTAWKDSVFNYETLQRITQVQMQNEPERRNMQIEFERKKQQMEIDRLRKNREEREAYFELKEQNQLQTRNLIIAVAAGLLLVVILLISRFIMKVRTNKKLHRLNNELSNLNTDLQQSQKSLRQLNATKDKFFSIIAHDLKNPFTALVSLADILHEKFQVMEEHRKSEILNQIHIAAKNTFRLLENLLEWSKAQQGGVVYTPVEVDVATEINHAVDLYVNALHQKDIDVKIDISQYLEVTTDKHMLSFVLRNLIGNAVKFTPFSGKIIIRMEKRKNDLLVSVKDTGVGMTRSVMERLFDLNVHYTTEGTNKERGAGLGLILCKDFVTKMGGDIMVESTPGEGSAFSFTLPYPAKSRLK
ncbi:MAG: tetratricopeptide repeat protein [Salinivirgaceae bacterium]|jgi:signal transduction histidine kinase|nr:tetratricopeptide repeat protein [Salinivirgaceae bacterium]